MNSPIIELLVTYHNFFREHTNLKDNATPAEAIGIEDIAPVPHYNTPPDMDKWVTFIQNAAIHSATVAA